MQNEYVITIDVDWAPDFVINNVANQLIEKNVCATWFVTHNSPAIKRLRTYPDLFELGIHPNFLPGSTHGNTPEKILAHCMDLVPEAKSMRTHGLFQSSNLLFKIIQSTPINIDSSIFLPQTPYIQTCEYCCYGRKLLRIPYIWEDDFEMLQQTPNWHFSGRFALPGLKIFTFHPVHIYLNSFDLSSYNQIKTRVSSIQYAQESEVNDMINSTIEGTKTLFEEMIEYLKSNNSRKISDLIP